MARLLVQSIVLSAFVGTVALATPDIEDTFAAWVAEREMAPAALVVLGPDGAITHSAGFGVTPDDPMAMASLSKSLAGQCTLTMARQGLIGLEEPIGPLLGWSGPAGAVTLAELLTHSGGLGPDATQVDIGGQNLTDPERVAGIIADVANRELWTGPGTYFYNNENYLVLEAALTAALGQDALDWCAANDPVLAKLQSLGPAPELFALTFAGGLALSTADLAGLFHQLEPAEDWPRADLSETVSYGPGVILRETAAGTVLFHVGGVCTLRGPNLGAFAVKLADGQSVAFTYSGCASDDDLAVLNQMILDFLL